MVVSFLGCAKMSRRSIKLNRFQKKCSFLEIIIINWILVLLLCLLLKDKPVCCLFIIFSFIRVCWYLILKINKFTGYMWRRCCWQVFVFKILIFHNFIIVCFSSNRSGDKFLSVFVKDFAVTGNNNYNYRFITLF